MKLDTVVAGGILALVSAYLLQRRLTAVLVWLALGVFVGSTMLKLSHTLSVLFGVLVVYVVSLVTKGTYEGFENEGEEEEKEDPKKPKPAPPKTDDPHLDVGTTILHAYRNLTPEQIGGMRRDTKELLELQKELMGSLSEMKPAIEQGAQLLSTFSTFFGDQQ
jgi:hypothetical protein